MRCALAILVLLVLAPGCATRGAIDYMADGWRDDLRVTFAPANGEAGGTLRARDLDRQSCSVTRRTASEAKKAEGCAKLEVLACWTPRHDPVSAPLDCDVQQAVVARDAAGHTFVLLK